MPLYEYECTAYHQRTVQFQKFSDPEVPSSPPCSGHRQRFLAAPAFSYKGGGWYADGYGNAKPKSSGESKSSSSDSGKSSSSSESSSATSAPAAPATASSPAPASSDKK